MARLLLFVTTPFWWYESVLVPICLVTLAPTPFWWGEVFWWLMGLSLSFSLLFGDAKSLSSPWTDFMVVIFLIVTVRTIA